MIIIKTKRLELRHWREEDLEEFAKMNSDPKVMEFFPYVLNQEQTEKAIRTFQGKINDRGWGWCAVSAPGVSDFIGAIGLNITPTDVYPGDVVEVGWRLAHEHWGKGYATEGALACLEYGFEKIGLKEIVSFTTVNNLRSRKVMEKIGLHYNPADEFDHPKIAEGHPLRRHVLYRLDRDEWKEMQGKA